MMTAVTHVAIEPGKEPAWDAACRERAAASKTQPGWVAVQLCVPADAPNQRVIVGTWETQVALDWFLATLFPRDSSVVRPLAAVPGVAVGRRRH